ncbi:Nucleoside diphosphate kinase [Nosema granulosis]|uniref:Nucleoside diphosphate kinase n=1 Tax=Nosema granulosis TaxID=83296 RepID=A0A9P6GWS5_9MICR|nr:Nucleoside diphosphate kinase [Nosema granulosis]
MSSTYIMIKPEGVKRGIVGKIIQRFEDKGLVLKRITSKIPTKELVREHYAHLSTKPFFESMVNKLSSDIVVCMEWEGKDIIDVTRSLIGATNPILASPGTIRGDWALDIDNNLVHGSDSAENAKRELDLWFA